MSPTRPSGSSLSVLGFSTAEERVYRIVLRHSGSSEQDLASLLGVGRTALRQRISHLLEGGLVELTGGAVVAHPPDEALGRLIADETQRLRQASGQLDSLRRLLPALARDHSAAHAPRGEPVQLEAHDGGDVAGLIRSLTASSTGEMLWLRPDQWRHPFGRELDDSVMALVRSGRRSRALYPAQVLEEAPDVVRARAEAGEHVRVLATVPSRLAIMGPSVALIPRRWGVHDERRFVVRQESIVSALTQLFESMWDRAVTVPGMDGGGDGGARRLLLDQLASGAKDEQIARALGLSLRTVRRRVAAVLDELGVDSRFEAGVEAVRRGWV